jgi:hypothetical protein
MASSTIIGKLSSATLVPERKKPVNKPKSTLSAAAPEFTPADFEEKATHVTTGTEISSSSVNLAQSLPPKASVNLITILQECKVPTTAIQEFTGHLNKLQIMGAIIKPKGFMIVDAFHKKLIRRKDLDLEIHLPDSKLKPEALAYTKSFATLERTNAFYSSLTLPLHAKFSCDLTITAPGYRSFDPYLWFGSDIFYFDADFNMVFDYTKRNMLIYDKIQSSLVNQKRIMFLTDWEMISSEPQVELAMSRYIKYLGQLEAKKCGIGYATCDDSVKSKHTAWTHYINNKSFTSICKEIHALSKLQAFNNSGGKVRIYLNSLMRIINHRLDATARIEGVPQNIDILKSFKVSLREMLINNSQSDNPIKSLEDFICDFFNSAYKSDTAGARLRNLNIIHGRKSPEKPGRSIATLFSSQPQESGVSTETATTVLSFAATSTT